MMPDRGGFRVPRSWSRPTGSRLSRSLSALARENTLRRRNVLGTFSATRRRARPGAEMNGGGAHRLPDRAVCDLSLRLVVELTGLEPVTPCLQSRCSPS